MKSNIKRSQKLHQRVIAFLNREQIDLLDKIGKDALFSKGTKLSRAKIISCLIDLLLELGIKTEVVSSLAELKQKIKEKIGLTWPSPKEIITFSDKETKPGWA